MKRAEGILLRWQKEREEDTDSNKTAPLQYIIDLEYKNYSKTCYWCHEKPMKKGEWLRQEIDIDC